MYRTPIRSGASPKTRRETTQTAVEVCSKVGSMSADRARVTDFEVQQRPPRPPPDPDAELAGVHTIMAGLALIKAGCVQVRPKPAPAPPAALAPAIAAPETAFLDTKAAAALLGVSPKTLEAWRARGAGPPYTRAGRLVRYRREDLLPVTSKR
jgi:hypothetical protein